MRVDNFLKATIFFIGLYLPAALSANTIPPADDTLARQPPPLEVTVEEKIDADLSQFTFFDEKGKPIQLKELADGKRPIILTPVYYNCPHLCTLTLNGLLEAIQQNKRYDLGKDYLIVSYSFNPEENYNLAIVKQRNYLRKLPKVTDQNLPEYQNYWRFLTGDVKNIAGISQAIGFKYLKEASTNLKKKDSEYVHPAVLVILTPDMKIARYLYGVNYPDVDYRMALLEAAAGKSSKTIGDRLMLTCFSFDPIKRKYTLVAWRIMRLGAIGLGLILAGFVAYLWFREKRKRA